MRSSGSRPTTAPTSAGPRASPRGHPAPVEPSVPSTEFEWTTPLPYYYLVLSADRPGDLAGQADWRTAGSGGRGWPSERTRTPPSSWACRPSASSCGRSRSAPRSAAWPAGSTPPRVAFINPANSVHPVGLDPDPGRGGPRRSRATSRGHRRRFAVGFLAGAFPRGWRGHARSDNVGNARVPLLLFGLALVLMMLFRPQGLLQPPAGRPSWPSPQTAAGWGDDRRGEVTWPAECAKGQARGPHRRRCRRASGPSRDEPRGTAGARDVHHGFGGVVAMNDVSLEVYKGEIFGLIGPNGAGKTTFFNCVTGVYPPTRARSSSTGSRSSGPSHSITEAGVARTFQNIRLFPTCRPWRTSWSGRRPPQDQRPASLPSQQRRCRGGAAGRCERRACWSSSASPARRARCARNLPYGDQRRLEIARALATRARSCSCSTSRPRA